MFTGGRLRLKGDAGGIKKKKKKKTAKTEQAEEDSGAGREDKRKTGEGEAAFLSSCLLFSSILRAICSMALSSMVMLGK